MLATLVADNLRVFLRPLLLLTSSVVMGLVVISSVTVSLIPVISPAIASSLLVVSAKLPLLVLLAVPVAIISSISPIVSLVLLVTVSLSLLEFPVSARVRLVRHILVISFFPFILVYITFDIESITGKVLLC